MIGFDVRPGATIGIPVGSRGIRNLPVILETLADIVRERGGVPRFLAAMGSHGSGTPEGQKAVLESLGITESALGAPVVCCTRCRAVDETEDGKPAYILDSALGLDGILVVNRVKAHTSFHGPIESGLVKMLAVGLGGPEGARRFHAADPAALPGLLVETGRALLRRLPVLGGLAVVENAYEETAVIRAVPRESMVEREIELLRTAKTLMPSLPVDDIDLLIIKKMGKNFSGTGIDTNVVGRTRIQGVPEPGRPRVRRIAVLDLSDESRGNATGIGLADFTTRRLVEKMDRRATYLNCLTSTFVMRAAVPMVFDTDAELLDAAVRSLGGVPPEALRIVVVSDTLHLSRCLVSEAPAHSLRERDGMELSDDPEPFVFDDAGNLPP